MIIKCLLSVVPVVPMVLCFFQETKKSPSPEKPASGLDSEQHAVLQRIMPNLEKEQNAWPVLAICKHSLEMCVVKSNQKEEKLLHYKNPSKCPDYLIFAKCSGSH